MKTASQEDSVKKKKEKTTYSLQKFCTHPNTVATMIRKRPVLSGWMYMTTISRSGTRPLNDV